MKVMKTAGPTVILLVVMVLKPINAESGITCQKGPGDVVRGTALLCPLHITKFLVIRARTGCMISWCLHAARVRCAKVHCSV